MDYHQEGRTNAIIGLTLATALASAAAILAASRPPTSFSPPELHYIRAILIILLVTCTGAIAKKKQYTSREYHALTLIPASAALLAIALIWLIRTFLGDHPPPAGRMATLSIISSWLCTSFFRFSTAQNSLLIGAISLATIIAVFGSNNDDPILLFFYITLSSASAIIFAIERENRERLVYAQARELYELSGELQDAIRAEKSVSESQLETIRSLSHDLRQPLLSARLYCGAIQRRLHLSGNIPPEIASIEHNINAATDELERILSANSLSETTARSLDLINPEIFLNEITQIYLPHAIAAGVKLRTTASRHRDFLIRSNKHALTRCAGNLIHNAIKFSANHSNTPCIQIRLISLGGEVRIDILDNGPGITPDAPMLLSNRAAIISPLKGYGLGLQSTRRLISSLPGHRLHISSLLIGGCRASIYAPQG